MGYDPTSLDDLGQRTGMEIGKVAAVLIGLELKGLVQSLGAAYQRR